MFGSTDDNECFVNYDAAGEAIDIGEILREEYKVRDILDVIPGRYNTTIIAIQ